MGNTLPVPESRPFFLIERIIDANVTVGVVNGSPPPKDASEEEIRLRNQGIRLGEWGQPIRRLKAFYKEEDELNYTFEGDVKLRVYKCPKGAFYGLSCYDLTQPERLLTTTEPIWSSNSQMYKPCSMGELSKEIDTMANFFEANRPK